MFNRGSFDIVTDKDDIHRAYDGNRRDCVIMEKIGTLYVVPHQEAWNDLGRWDAV